MKSTTSKPKKTTDPFISIDEERKPKFAALETRIGVEFSNKQLLQQIFVHRSYLNENPGFPLKHNERLEFLGDAVLELIVTEHLFQNFPNPEGELTNFRSALVKGKMLSRVAKELELGDILYLSRGERKSGGKARAIILANTYEALIGGIYLDQGYEPSKRFIVETLLGNLPDIIEQGLHIDPKSRLQEYAQEHQSVTPNYRVLSEAGPDHAKLFRVGVFLSDEMIGSGEGTSKQAAEQEAANQALKVWVDRTI